MLPCPIDRRLRRCVRSGTQPLFVVVRRRRSCVRRPDAGGAAASGGARRAGVVRAWRSAACVRVLRSCGCGRRCGGGCATTLAVCSALARRGAWRERGGGVCARRAQRDRPVFSCKRGAVLRRGQRARASPVPVLEMSLMSLQAVIAVAAAVPPVYVMRAYGAAGVPPRATTEFEFDSDSDVS